MGVKNASERIRKTQLRSNKRSLGGMTDVFVSGCSG